MSLLKWIAGIKWSGKPICKKYVDGYFDQVYDNLNKLELQDWSYKFEAWCRESGIHYVKYDNGSFDCPCKECKRRVLFEAYMIRTGYRLDGKTWRHRDGYSYSYGRHNAYHNMENDLAYAQFDPEMDCKPISNIAPKLPIPGSGMERLGC